MAHIIETHTPYFLCHEFQPSVFLKPITTSLYDESWTNMMLKILEDANMEMLKNLEKAQESQRRQFDKTSQIRRFKEGDLVLIQIPPKPGMNSKVLHNLGGTIQDYENGVGSQCKNLTSEREKINSLKHFIL